MNEINLGVVAHRRGADFLIEGTETAASHARHRLAQNLVQFLIQRRRIIPMRAEQLGERGSRLGRRTPAHCKMQEFVREEEPAPRDGHRLSRCDVMDESVAPDIEGG